MSDKEHITGFLFYEILHNRLLSLTDWNEKVRATRGLMREYHPDVRRDLTENAFRDNSEESRLVLEALQEEDS